MPVCTEQWCEDIGQFHSFTHTIRVINLSIHGFSITTKFFHILKISFAVYSCDNMVILQYSRVQRKKLQSSTFHAAIEMQIA